MSITYPSLDQATASVLPPTRRPLDEGSGQRPGAVSSYAGVHRRRDGQGRSPGDASRRPGHRARHRRGRWQCPDRGSGRSPPGPRSRRPAGISDGNR